jgi:hypothetical protein
MSVEDKYLLKLEENIKNAKTLDEKAIAYSNLINHIGGTSFSIAEAFIEGYKTKEQEIKDEQET